MTDKEIDYLKRAAKKICKEQGCSHTVALDHLAKKHGFNRWSLLMKQHNKEQKHDGR